MVYRQWSAGTRRSLIAIAITVGLLLVLPRPSAYAAPSDPQPIPHSVADHTNCVGCHATGLGGATQFPADHQGRDNSSCTACHKEATATSPSPSTPTSTTSNQGQGSSVVADWSAKSCQSCHPKEWSDWSQSGHAMTLSAQLLNKDHNSSEQLDQTCVKCHSPELGTEKIANIVGPLDTKGPWQLVGKYASLGDSPAISCLACHQPHAVNPAGSSPGADFGDESTFYRGVPAPEVTNLKIFDAFAQKHIDPAQIAPVMNGDQPVPIAQSLSNRLCATCHGTEQAESNLFEPTKAPEGDNGVGSGDDRTPTGAHQGIQCVTCHMPGGSHTFNPMNSCGQCHGSGTSTASLDYVTRQADTSFNDASLSMLSGNPSPLNIHSLDKTQVWPPAEVTMTATDTGPTVTYTISIRNHADWDLSNVTVKGTVPAGAKTGDAWVGSPDNPGSFDGYAASLTIPSIPAGGTSDTITYRVVKGSATDFTAHAWVSWEKEIPGTAVSADVNITK